MGRTKKIKEPKVKKVRVKKVKLTKLERKVEIIKGKLGKRQGTFFIQDMKGKYCLKIKTIENNKIKNKALFQIADLEFLTAIANKLKTDLDMPFNEDIVLSLRKEKSEDTPDLNKNLFKEFAGHCFISLDFGAIFLTSKGYYVKRNYETTEGVKINMILPKASNAFGKCKDLLISYPKETQEKILKEAVRLGSIEDKNSIRIILGLNPVTVTFDDNLNRIVEI